MLACNRTDAATVRDVNGDASRCFDWILWLSQLLATDVRAMNRCSSAAAAAENDAETIATVSHSLLALSLSMCVTTTGVHPACSCCHSATLVMLGNVILCVYTVRVDRL